MLVCSYTFCDKPQSQQGTSANGLWGIRHSLISREATWFDYINMTTRICSHHSRAAASARASASWCKAKSGRQRVRPKGPKNRSSRKWGPRGQQSAVNAAISSLRRRRQRAVHVPVFLTADFASEFLHVVQKRSCFCKVGIPN